ncbi:uncharacterized protein LOC128105589 isoform X3 [Peromyscus californicus insignis]|uniref:uncharacterized protein LOC128105589 isoform X3 n=1 Tax=Peromyscus californicus insignis TaxID=564181 RepID=UPI0022A7272C|nr:uncharacterized protein LOC128105589 isoform X3 [Peromyscus californicus insignis]
MREGSGRGKTSFPGPAGPGPFSYAPQFRDLRDRGLGELLLSRRRDGTTSRGLEVRLLRATFPKLDSSKWYTGNSCDPSIWYTDTRCTAAGHVHLSLNIPCHIPTARCSTAASHHTSHSSTSTPGPRSSGQQGTSLGITCSGMTCTPPEAALAGPVCLPFLCAQLMC